MIEIAEILYRWQQGMKKQAIANSLGIARNTVKKEICLAQEHGLGMQSDQEEVNKYIADKAGERSSKVMRGKQTERLKQHHDQIVNWLEMPHMTMMQIQRLLLEQGEEYIWKLYQENRGK